MRISGVIFLFACFFTFAYFPAIAQSKRNSVNMSKMDIVRLIAQYPYCFEEMIGELQYRRNDSIMYSCDSEIQTLMVCQIIRYDLDSTHCSLESVMYTTEDFEKGVNAHKILYRNFRNTVFLPMGIKMRFRGDYIQPSRELKVNNVILKLIPNDEIIEDMRVQISLNYVNDKWEVKLRIADRQRL